MDTDPSFSWHELWATLSVRDHCRPGAFVAEVLTYDKLIIPVPPTEEDGLTAPEAQEERARWQRADWEPERQRQLLKILGERAEPIPWTSARQAEWREAMRTSFAEARCNGYFMTGSVLQKFAPAMARAVVAVSPYWSLDDLESKSKIRLRQPHEQLPASSLMAVLGHELLLPEVLGPDDFGVLEDAVEVSRDPEYRTRRQALYQWQQQFLSREGLTDARSIKTAVNEMADQVAKLNSVNKRQAKWKPLTRVFSFLRVGAGVAEWVPAAGTVAKGVKAMVSVGQYVADEYGPGAQAETATIPAATLFLDARQKLEIEA